MVKGKWKRRLTSFDEDDGYELRKKIGFEWKKGCVCLTRERDYGVDGEWLRGDNIVLGVFHCQDYWLIGYEKH